MIKQQGRTEREITEGILKELRWDPSIGESEIEVTVRDGVVTLAGHVDSYAKKAAAQEAAHRVAGVLDVANEIKVSSKDTDLDGDGQIAQAVRYALEWDSFVPHERIHSTVSNGWVTLEGDVPTWDARDDAERAVSDLPHVSGVINKIAVVSAAAEPADIRLAVDEAIRRTAENESRRVQVAVQQGTVTIHGTVHSLHEKDAILEAVRNAHGVREVKDDLAVDPNL